MAADPVYGNPNKRCFSEFGLPSVVEVEERPMCRHCFRLGLTPARSQEIHRASGTQPQTGVIRSTQ